MCWTQERYEIYQVGIAHDGAWFTGKNARDLLEKGSTGELSRCTILPDPSQPGLYLVREAGLELLTPLDVVFPVLHGSFGEDGTIQGLLELADLAYVGAGVTGSAVGMDKGIFKDVMRANNIPTVESIVVLRTEIEKDMDLCRPKVRGLGLVPVVCQTRQPGLLGRHHQMPQSCRPDRGPDGSRHLRPAGAGRARRKRPRDRGQRPGE